MAKTRVKDIPLEEIHVLENRQRSIVSTEDLEPSIKAKGVIQPIVVRAPEDAEGVGLPWVLVAGERRFRASQRIGLRTIPAVLKSDLPADLAREIELEENVKRRSLPWRDEVRAIGDLDLIYKAKNPDFSTADLARSLSYTSQNIQTYLRVYREIDNPKIASFETFSAAANWCSRADIRKIDDAMSQLTEAGVTLFSTPHKQSTINAVKDDTGVNLDHKILVAVAQPKITPPVQRAFESSIERASFLDWAPEYTGQRFNFLHCDFPFGINVFAGKMAGGHNADNSYDDSEDTYWTLMKCLCDNLDRLMAPSAHLMFWLSMDFYQETLLRFSEWAPELEFSNFPLIWVKSDNVGILPDPKRGPRRIYETALIASREDRWIAKPVSNAYSCPTDKSTHPSTKPEPMLRHFFQMYVSETTRLLDPTCGSGSALRAAESLGAEYVWGLEQDKTHFDNATSALRNFRMLRMVNK